MLSYLDFPAGAADVPASELMLWGLIAASFLAWALRGRSLWNLLAPEHFGAALGSVVLLTFAWSIRVKFPGIAQAFASGLPIQLMGAGLLTVMFGLQGALLLLAVIAGLASWLLLAEAPFPPAAWLLASAQRFFWLGALPALVSACACSLIRAMLPRQPFVFIFGHGYFATLLAVAVSSLISAGLARLSVGGIPAFGWTEIIAASLTLAFAEAFITGLLVAAFVVYRPRWVATFDDREYLR